HVVENPFVDKHLPFLNHPIIVTLVLISILGAIFLKGFKEAIGLAVILVGVYLLLNAVVIGTGLYHLLTESGHFTNWKFSLLTDPRIHGSPLLMIGIS